MREFILLSLAGFTTPFNTDNLKANRMDLVCRFISNALCISDGYRRDTNVYVVLCGPREPPKTVVFNGATLKDLDPDEKSIANIINLALKKGIGLKLNELRTVSDSVQIIKKSFEQLVKEKIGQAYYLDKDGIDIDDLNLDAGVFLVGGNKGFPRRTKGLLDRYGIKPVSVSPVELFSSHIPVLIHNAIDKNIKRD
jgi:tRNA (pseudouridine54-N1)-methyltransferase